MTPFEKNYLLVSSYLDGVKYTDYRICLITCYVALGSGILFTYPEVSTIAGVQGLIVYGLSSALPLLVFGIVGPIIRKRCPDGFVLTEWTRQRYGQIAGIYLSILTYVLLQLCAFYICCCHSDKSV